MALANNALLEPSLRTAPPHVPPVPLDTSPPSEALIVPPVPLVPTPSTTLAQAAPSDSSATLPESPTVPPALLDLLTPPKEAPTVLSVPQATTA